MQVRGFPVNWRPFVEGYCETRDRIGFDCFTHRLVCIKQMVVEFCLPSGYKLVVIFIRSISNVGCSFDRNELSHYRGYISESSGKFEIRVTRTNRGCRLCFLIYSDLNRLTGFANAALID